MPYANRERPAVSNPCSMSIGLFACLRAYLVGLCFLLLPGLTLAAPYAYISNRDSANVSVIDTATNTVTATVAVGTAPFGVAVNPAGTRVYVANTDSNNVSVIDTATNTVTATVAVGTYPVAFGQFIGPALATPTTPATIPTMSEWGMILLSSLLALGTILILRRQRQ